ncbi:RidA family protein [Aureimonas fodinaquatilis]|uniref:RidA family protein n=1 Tax=Aureimonas fodinaquatilis TaxID=2565783 RepID=A0A5B0E3K9_9HYPH|nr:RidA family protein [Aureimonas fodinaquatilis]KAA0972521.1 RidA family protein [Aureimonas fodinaquatilis]
MIERIESTPIMHRIVKTNGMLYLGGIVADDFSEDMEGQTRQVCGKIEKLLVQAGSGKDKIVSAQIYVTDISAKGGLNKAWTEWLATEHLPARATVGVASLGSENTLIEIVVVATA